MDSSVYENPLNAHALEGAIRILKLLALEAEDPDLERLVKEIESVYLKNKGDSDGTQQG